MLTFGGRQVGRGQFWLSSPGAPLVILIHGGFWRQGKTLRLTEPLARALSAQGLAVWNIEYRAGPGRWRRSLADVAAAVDHTRTLAAAHCLDARQPVVVGHSAGGQLALWTAARKRSGVCCSGQGAPVAPRAVVVLAGVCHLAGAAVAGLGDGAVPEFLGGGPDEVPARYDTCCPTRLLPLRVPLQIVHGTADPCVPAAMSRKYAHAARAAGDQAEFIELTADHRALIDPGTAAGRRVISIIVRAAFGPHSSNQLCTAPL